MKSNLCVQLDSYRVNSQKYPSIIREHTVQYESLIEDTDFNSLKVRILGNNLTKQDVLVLSYCFARYDERKYDRSKYGAPPAFLMTMAQIAEELGVSQKKAFSLITDITYKTWGESFDIELQRLLNKYDDVVARSNLEDLLGIGGGTFSHIAKGKKAENGKKTLPTRGLAMSIAIFFKLNLGEATDFVINCGFGLREDCLPDSYFVHFIENGMTGTRDFVSGVMIEAMRENAKREAYNRNVAKRDRKALIELDPFFSARSKTGRHSYRNLSIDDCKDENGNVTKAAIRHAIDFGNDFD